MAMWVKREELEPRHTDETSYHVPIFRDYHEDDREEDEDQDPGDEHEPVELLRASGLGPSAAIQAPALPIALVT